MPNVIEDFRKYIKYERQLSAETVNHYVQVLKIYDNFLHSDITVAKELLDIDREDIGRYLAHIKDRQLSRASIVNNVAILRTFYKWAAYINGKENILRVNFYLTNIIKVKNESKIPYVPTREEVDKLRSTLREFTRIMSFDSENYSYRKAVMARAIIETLITTGMRSGELRTLKRKDINLDAMTIFIRHGKGSVQRVSIFGPAAAEALKEYLEARKFGQEDLVFPIRRGNGLNYIIKRWAMRAKTNQLVHAHSFRHYFITESRKAGIPQEVVAEQVGHRSLTSTRIYTHFGLDDIKANYQKINI